MVLNIIVDSYDADMRFAAQSRMCATEGCIIAEVSDSVAERPVQPFFVLVGRELGEEIRRKNYSKQLLFSEIKSFFFF